MKFIQGVLGLAIIVYLGFVPIYVLFYNSSEDAVEDLSLASNAESFINLESKYGKMFSSEDKKFILNGIEQLKELNKKRNIDITKSVYSLLKNDREVTDLKIIDNSKEEFGAMGSFILSNYAGGEIYTITWKYMGRQYNLPVIVIPPSFFKMRRAIAYTTDENLLKKVYEVHR